MVVVLGGTALPGPARAEAGLAGVCPDGSFFVVARAEDAPCARPKFVPASELPPLKPQYLPRPYTWYLDQEARDENNPYNLVDKAQQIRDLRSGAQTSTAGTEQGARGTSTAPRPVAPTVQAEPESPAPGVALELAADELADLVQVITLQQEIAPATLRVEDVRGTPELQIKFAYSPAFEARVRQELAVGPDSGSVVAFSVRSDQAVEFYPRFFVTQEGVTFRPDARRTSEVGFVLGQPGEMSAGWLSVGYLVLPGRFDLSQPVTLWWNDRRIEATLATRP